VERKGVDNNDSPTRIQGTERSLEAAAVEAGGTGKKLHAVFLIALFIL
jgi:hypothetical protein